MSIIKIPGGGAHFMVGPAADADKIQATITARHEFSMAYCAERGWDPNGLSMGQVMEIRAQPEWVAGGAL